MLTITQPDYETIRAALQTSLSSKNTWRDLLPSSTGQTLTDWIAAVGATDQYAIQHAFREAFRTARLDSSILAQAIMLGVRLGRKTPSSVGVTLTKATTDVVTIPAFTQFTSSSGLLFNREAITLHGAATVNATLYEGEIITQVVTSDGNPYQLFVSADDGFKISDSDVEVRINNIKMPLTQRGLWRYKNQSGVADSTSPTGQLILTFGSEEFGTMPSTGDNVEIKYALTSGALGQTAAILGDSIVVADYPVVKLVATTGLAGGAEEKSSLFYRKLSPQLFSGETSATAKDEFSAKANDYPGVFDAKVVGQRELAPGDPRWMNLVQVTLLTDHLWSGAEWGEFTKWYQARTTYPVRFHRRDPLAVPVNIAMKIFCQPRADLAAVKAKAETAVQRLFLLRPGLLDSNLFMSDIYAAARSSDAAIEYVQMLAPTDNVIVGVSSPAPLVLSAAGGTLPAGQYSYGVTCVTSTGETLATNFKSLVIAGGGVTISWDPVQLAQSYNVYGRDAVTLGLLGNTTGHTFTDNGSATPVSGLPIVTGAGHRYPSLGVLAVDVQFTSREFYDLGNIR